MGAKKVLKYTYTIGSGIQHPYEAEYVLGSGVGFSERMTNGHSDNPDPGDD
jgi:hypothetical protein